MNIFKLNIDEGTSFFISIIFHLIKSNPKISHYLVILCSMRVSVCWQLGIFQISKSELEFLRHFSDGRLLLAKNKSVEAQEDLRVHCWLTQDQFLT